MSNLEHMNLVQALTFVENADKRMFDSVSDSLTVAPVPPFHQKLIGLRYKGAIFSLIFVSAAAFIIGGFFLNAASAGASFFSGPRAALIIIGAIVFLAALIMYFYISSISSKAKDGVKFDHAGVYKKFFDTYFDNFEFERFANLSEVTDFSTIRPTGVPSDANVSRRVPGAVGTINGMKYFSAWTVWHWTRTYSTGKTTHTQEYYHEVFGMKAEGVAERFENLSLEMHFPKGKLLNFNKGDLENKDFNNMTSVTTSDDVGLRRLLTPYTQEQIVKMSAEDSRPTDVYLMRNSFIVIMAEKSPLFSIDFRYSSDREALVQSIVFDFKKDISVFISLMSKITVFKTLKTG